MSSEQMHDEMELQVLMDDFYRNPLYLSYSALKLLIWSPAAYKKKYIDKVYEEKMDKFLINGKVIHCLLLNNHMFEDLFVISPTSVPTGNTKYVVDKVFAHHMENSYDQAGLADYGTKIIEILADINLHQSLKTDEQRIAKIITEETQHYFNFLITKGSRDIIDQETYDACVASADMIKANEVISSLMGLNVTDFDTSIEIINEEELRLELNGKYPFGLKGILDNLVIDHTSKTIRINDVKTTGKSLEDFSESVEFYKYWLQGAIYVSLVLVHWKELIDKGYKVELRFIVIDSNQQVYPFKVKPLTLESWFIKLKEVLELASFHYTNRSFTLPKAFALGEVEL